MSAGTRLPGTPLPRCAWQGSAGIGIAGDTWGEPDGQLVVLLHGGGQTRHAWKGTGELLGAAGYFAVAFDARGHGDSDWAADGSYGQDVMVRDLERVMETLGKPRPVLVGASMGGATSLIAVGEGHVDAGALILVDIAPRQDAVGVSKVKSFMAQRPEGFDSLEEVAHAIGKYQPQRSGPRTVDGLAKNVRQGADGRFYWHWDPRLIQTNPDHTQRVQRREARAQRMEASARRLTLPTLLVRGGLSDVLSEDGVRQFLELCPSSDYVNVTDAGHMVVGDRNDLFGHAVIAFLERVLPATRGTLP